MEGAVGDSNKSAGLGVMSVLAIALQKAKGGDEVSLLEEMTSVWEPGFFCLLYIEWLVSDDGVRCASKASIWRESLTCLAWILGADCLLRLMAETGLAIILTYLNLNL